MSRVSETEVADHVATWLASNGLDVYEEVQVRYGPRADLVGVNGRYRVIVETKTSLSLALIEQGVRWTRLGLANHVYIASPSSPSAEAVGICERFGVGILSVNLDCTRGEIGKVIDYGATWHRTRSPIAVVDGQRRGAGVKAGSAAGGHWSPWRDSMRRLRYYVQQHPGCKVQDAIKDLGKMHYASNSTAIATTRERLVRGQVPGLRIDADFRVWIEEKAP